MKKWLLSIAIALAVCLSLPPTVALAAEIPVNGDTTTWENGGTYVVSDDVTLSAVTIEGNVTLRLDSGTLTINSKVNVPFGSQLTIAGGSGKLVAGQGIADSGTLNITGGTVVANGGWLQAGISCATVNISGGTVNAKGGGGSAGIGGGNGGAGGNITISGGTVTAEAGSDAAGIGGGAWGNGGTITITGGTVNVSGSIGKGNGGKTEATITLNGGAVVVATSVGVSDQSEKGAWNVVLFEGNGNGQIYGSPTLTADAQIPARKTLVIDSGKTLTVAQGATLTNNGTIENNGTIRNNGTIINNGTISGSGTLQGNGYSMSVTFNANGGEGAPASVVVTSGKTYSLPSAAPTKTGYTFVGWYTQANGGDQVTAQTTVTQTKSHTLYAHWTETVANSVTLDKTSLTLDYGGTHTITATVSPADAMDKTVTWSSDDPSIATVDQNGLVTAVGAGSTRVVAQANSGNNVTAACSVTVNKLRPVTGNFAYTAPSDLTYNGEAKTATVTAKDGINGMGEVTVKYSAVPINAGDYTVSIDVAEGGNYTAATDLTDEKWTFTIEQAKPDELATPTVGAVTYGAKLEDIALDAGWQWVNKETVPTVTNNGYDAEYAVSDDSNYDWSGVDGYKADTHKVTRTVTVTVRPATLTPSVGSVDNKTYSGDGKATGTITLEGAVNNEQPTATGTFTFVDFNAGDNKAVNVTGIKLDDAWTANYALSTDHLDNVATNAAIAKAPVIFDVTNNSVPYVHDTAQHAIVTPSSTPLLPEGGYTVTYKNDNTETADPIHQDEYDVMVEITNPNFKHASSNDAKIKVGVFTITAAAYPDQNAIVWPTASGITYGQALSESTLTGGSGSVAGGSGSFQWKDDTAKPSVATTTAKVVFTPDDAEYAALEKDVDITVSPATVGLSWAGYEGLTYGDRVNVTAEATGLIPDDTCTVTVTNGGDGEVLNAGNYTAEATGLSNSNYALPTLAADRQRPYTVARIQYTGVITFTPKVEADGEQGVRVTLPDYAALTGGTVGTPVLQEADTEDAFLENIALDATALTFDAKASAHGKSNTITIPVTGCTNYENFTVTITVTATNVEVTLSGFAVEHDRMEEGTDRYIKVYDGNAIQPTVDLDALRVIYTDGSERDVTDHLKAQMDEHGNAACLSYTYYQGGQPLNPNQAPSAVGDYSLVVSLDDGEHAGEQAPIIFSIVPAQGQAKVELDGWTYNQTPATPTYSSTTNQDAQVSVSYSGTTDGGQTYGPTSDQPDQAGSYTVTVTYVATATHTKATAQADFTIAKATPNYGELPTGLTATVGDTLESVELGEHWSWDAPETKLTETGKYPATYDLEDPNYNTVSANLTVTVTDPVVKDTTTLSPGDKVVTQDGATITHTGETVTVEKDGQTVTVKLPQSGDVTVDEKGTVTAPKDTAVQTGEDGTEVALPSGGSVTPEGDVTAPAVTVGSTTIKAPEGQTVTTDKDGNTTAPDGSAVQTGENGPEVILPSGGNVTPAGTVTAPTVTVGDTTIKAPEGETVTTDKDGKTIAPEDSKVQTGEDGPEMALPQGGSVTPAGQVTAPSVTVGDTTVKAPEGQTVTTDKDGNTTAPAESTVKTGKDGPEMTLPQGGSVTPEGSLTAPAITVGDTTVTAKDPEGNPVTVAPDGTITVPENSTVKTGEDGPEVALPQGGSVTPEGNVTAPAVTVGGTTIEAPAGEDKPITVAPDGKTDAPAGATVKTGETVITLPDGGKVDDAGAVTVPEGGKITVTVPGKTEGETTTVTIKPAQGGEITVDEDGKVTIPGGSSVQIGDQTPVVVPDKGGSVDPSTGTVDTGAKPSRPTGGGSSRPTVRPTEPEDKTPETPSSVDFIDVSPDDWYYDAVQYVTAHGLFKGTSDTTFSPNATTTRAMLMTVLARMSGGDATGGETWYAKALAWAVENGISDGTNPEGLITREQLAAMLYRCADPTATDKSDALGGFADAGRVSDWALDAMQWAVKAGIIQGKDAHRLDPQGRATRAEVATMLMRYLEQRAK